MHFDNAGVKTDIDTTIDSYLATKVSGLAPVNFNTDPVIMKSTITVIRYRITLKN